MFQYLIFTVALYLTSLAVLLEEKGITDTIESQSTPLIVTILSTLTVVAGFAYTWLRDSRNRQWDAEDRERVKRENQEALDRQTKFFKDELTLSQKLASIEGAERAMKVKAVLLEQQAIVKEELENQNGKVETALIKREIVTKNDLRREAEQIRNAVNANTSISKNAFNEANALNKKLERMSEAGLIQMTPEKIEEIAKNETAFEPKEDYPDAPEREPQEKPD